jgi:tRNA 2-thiouridine synthesizing protein A
MLVGFFIKEVSFAGFVSLHHLDIRQTPLEIATQQCKSVFHTEARVLQMSVDVLDLKGLKCPLPVLKTRKAMKALGPGVRLWVETTDPLAAIDMPNFCRESGHQLIETGQTGQTLRFLIEKGE